MTSVLYEFVAILLVVKYTPGKNVDNNNGENHLRSSEFLTSNNNEAENLKSYSRLSFSLILLLYARAVWCKNHALRILSHLLTRNFLSQKHDRK